MKWIDSYDLDKLWAGRRDCQETLPLLVRKLIRATSTSIQTIKFPAGENVLIGGWDGILEVTEETEYLPIGVSLWEFGANKDPKGKAEDDYKKRTANPLGYNPSESTYIFVTPRLWKNSEDWVTEKKKEGVWKDIKVYNSEILEEWIEIAPTVGSWLSRHIGKFPEGGIQPTDDFWEEWSSGEKFKLNSDILLGGRENEKFEVINLASNPVICGVQSLSRQESLAFIISSFVDNSDKSEDFFARSSDAIEKSGLNPIEVSTERGDAFDLNVAQMAEEVWGADNQYYFLYKRLSDVTHGSWRVIAKYHLMQSLNPMQNGLYWYSDNENKFAGLIPAFFGITVSLKSMISICNQIDHEITNEMTEVLEAFESKVSKTYLDTIKILFYLKKNKSQQPTIKLQ